MEARSAYTLLLESIFDCSYVVYILSIQGTVVQNIVSLTSSLVVKVQMQKLLTFFQQKY